MIFFVLENRKNALKNSCQTSPKTPYVKIIFKTYLKNIKNMLRIF